MSSTKSDIRPKRDSIEINIFSNNIIELDRVKCNCLLSIKDLVTKLIPKKCMKTSDDDV
jgi:hypothetical protein